jgi:hypothetical protein
MNPSASVRGAIMAGFAVAVAMLLCMGSATHGLPF